MAKDIEDVVSDATETTTQDRVIDQDAVKAILQSRVLINAPGKFKVKVTSANPYQDRTICNSIY